MNAVAAPSPRQITWLRRRRAVAAAWREFRHHRPGMIGLVVLTLIVLMALAAPLLADESGLKVINTTENPVWASPSDFSPLGTDNYGRSIMTQFIYGARISLLVGLAATVLAILIGSIVGIVAGFLGGIIGGVLMRITEWFLVIPFLPLAIVLAAILGPVDQEHHPRDRRSRLGRRTRDSSAPRCLPSRSATTSIAAVPSARPTGTS